MALDRRGRAIERLAKERDDLEAENKRMKNALQAWIDVNKGAPNKYQWAKQALEGIKYNGHKTKRTSTRQK